jgi:hypothetical protein
VFSKWKHPFLDWILLTSGIAALLSKHGGGWMKTTAIYGAIVIAAAFMRNYVCL